MDVFVGEIRAFPYNFIPDGWLQCDGSRQSIQRYVALASLLQNIWGNDGTYFNLPDLRESALLGQGTYSDPTGTVNYKIGQKVGQATVTLNSSELASHTHALQTQAVVARLTAPSSAALASLPINATVTPNVNYAMHAKTTDTAPVTMAAASVGPVGTGGAHSNQSPYQYFVFCIAVEGYYPVAA